MAANTQSWLDDAFKSAKNEFLKKLKNPAQYDFSKVTSIEEIYAQAEKIQKDQAKTKTLRGLKKLEPLINALRDYAGVIEVFVQVKPDVMGLVWVRTVPP